MILLELNRVWRMKSCKCASTKWSKLRSTLWRRNYTMASNTSPTAYSEIKLEMKIKMIVNMKMEWNEKPWPISIQHEPNQSDWRLQLHVLFIVSSFFKLNFFDLPARGKRKWDSVICVYIVCVTDDGDDLLTLLFVHRSFTFLFRCCCCHFFYFYFYYYFISFWILIITGLIWFIYLLVGFRRISSNFSLSERARRMGRRASLYISSCTLRNQIQDSWIDNSFLLHVSLARCVSFMSCCFSLN